MNPETNFSYPLVVEVTLYRHNLNDNRVLSEIRRNAHIQKVKDSDNHFFVSKEDISSILNRRFKDDILYQNGLNDKELVKNITTPFFLHSVVTTFSNLKYIKFSISNSRDYTRRSGNTVTFEYKILHAKVDLPALVKNRNELSAIQKLLSYIKFWKHDPFYPQTFVECHSRDLISQINYYEGSSQDFVTEFGETINLLLSYIDMKLEGDNSSLHMVVMH